jgi:UDP-N-acetylglucosamine acyltransferase
MARVHASALVDPGAELADDVEIGPFCVVGPGVRIGAGTKVGAHVVLSGRTRIGRGNRIFPFCSLGTEPQDKKYGGEDTALEIGDGNTIREYCLFNTGTAQGGGTTRVGSDNWIMAYVHVAHDCTIGDHTIFANAVTLAGHVEVGDWAFIGGTAAVHQFVRIGVHALCGGGTILLQDLPPYVLCDGHPAQAHGIHVEGLKRRNFSADAIAALRRAYRTVYRDGLSLADARAAIEEQARQAPEDCARPLRELAGFLAVPGRGIVR